LRAFTRTDSRPKLSRITFGNSLRTAFDMPHAPVLEVRDLSFGRLAVTELRCDVPNYGESAPIPEQDAIMVSLQLRANLQHEVFEDRKPLPPAPVLEGTTCFFDLRRAVTARSLQPFHCINFAFPVRALDESNEDVLHRFELGRSPRMGVHDPVIHALGTALLPALAEPDAASRLFVDHVLFAMRAHVAQRFGAPIQRSAQHGGLATWQERRATAYIEAHLSESISLADLARECSLSVAQFARAFKTSMRLAPHQYLTERRVERARQLLLHTELPLADVAVRCGFADQSHFTKVFRRSFGASPGKLRAASSPKRF
jgi:AraC-like DNA-binding protein